MIDLEELIKRKRNQILTFVKGIIRSTRVNSNRAKTCAKYDQSMYKVSFVEMLYPLCH